MGWHASWSGRAGAEFAVSQRSDRAATETRRRRLSDTKRAVRPPVDRSGTLSRRNAPTFDTLASEVVMRRYGLLAFFAVVMAAIPLAANAQQAYAIGGASIFAGPGPDYPVVAQLGPGAGVRINGCLAGYQWCDISFGPNRGWAYAGDLGYPYHNNRVPVLSYGPQLALPIVTFSLGTYWDRYYRARPWYHERTQWERHWNDHRNDAYRGNQNYHGNQNYQGNQRYEQPRNNQQQRYEQQHNDYRGNAQPYSNSQAEQFRRDKAAGRDTTRDNAPRPGQLPPGSSQPPTTPGYYGGSG
jgi:uncharacterized protein YraI